MKYVFSFNADKCCACGACKIACIDQHDTDIAAGEPCLRDIAACEIKHSDGSFEFQYLTTSCLHCENAACISACPKNCLFRDPETQLVVFDNSNCIGCKLCSKACPHDAIRFRKSDGKMIKCDGCYIRIQHGLAPACVRACPFGALSCTAAQEE